MKPIIVIPTYNEKQNISQLIELIFSLHIPGLEIIVVDDNSPDDTAGAVEEKTRDFPIHLIKRQTKLGIGSAYIAGFKKALSMGADYIMEMDADFSHDPNDIPRFLQATSEADLIIGSRKIIGGKITGWGWTRNLMSNCAMVFARLILGLVVKDVTAGFRCYHRKILESIDLDKIKSNGYAFQEEMLYRTQMAGFKIKEIPVIFADRQKGKSKLSTKDIAEFFFVMIGLKLKKL